MADWCLRPALAAEEGSGTVAAGGVKSLVVIWVGVLIVLLTLVH